MCESGNYKNIQYLESILSLVVQFKVTVRRSESPGQCRTEIFSAFTLKAKDWIWVKSKAQCGKSKIKSGIQIGSSLKNLNAAIFQSHMLFTFFLWNRENRDVFEESL